MARTRAQRRRHSVLLVIALVVTLLVVVFARDVSRSAHEATSPRRIENRSFAQLANRLVALENNVDFHLAYLLGHGRGLSRSVFAARLAQIDQQLGPLLSDAALLHRPVLAHHVQREVVTLTEQRVASDQAIIGATMTALSLPGAIAPGTSPANAQAALAAAVAHWNYKRFSLVGEPGRVSLDAATSPLAHLALASTLAALTAEPSLTLTRAVSISAVAVTPSPLPAPAGQIVVPPVTSIHVGVSVTNFAYCTQPVAVTVTLTSSSGATQRRVMHATIGPDASFAFDASSLTTYPSEKATLRVALAGAPASATGTLEKVYAVTLAPSGNG